MTDLEIEQMAANHMLMWARGLFDETRLNTLSLEDRDYAEWLIESASITIEWGDIDN